MPQEPDGTANPEVDDLARRVLDGVKKEPVPDKIIELAAKLESVLVAKRKPSEKDSG